MLWLVVFCFFVFLLLFSFSFVLLPYRKHLTLLSGEAFSFERLQTAPRGSAAHFPFQAEKLCTITTKTGILAACQGPCRTSLTPPKLPTGVLLVKHHVKNTCTFNAQRNLAQLGTGLILLVLNIWECVCLCETSWLFPSSRSRQGCLSQRALSTF